MVVGSPLPCHLVWQARVSFLRAIWICLCLRGTPSKRSSCEGKGQKWEEAGGQEGAGVFLKGRPLFFIHSTEVCREEVSCMGSHK